MVSSAWAGLSSKEKKTGSIIGVINMPQKKRSPLRVRIPVSQRPGQRMRAKKGRGSYARRFMKKQLLNEVNAANSGKASE